VGSAPARFLDDGPDLRRLQPRGRRSIPGALRPRGDADRPPAPLDAPGPRGVRWPPGGCSRPRVPEAWAGAANGAFRTEPSERSLQNGAFRTRVPPRSSTRPAGAITAPRAFASKRALMSPGRRKADERAAGRRTHGLRAAASGPARPVEVALPMPPYAYGSGVSMAGPRCLWPARGVYGRPDVTGTGAPDHHPPIARLVVADTAGRRDVAVGVGFRRVRHEDHPTVTRIGALAPGSKVTEPGGAPCPGRGRNAPGPPAIKLGRGSGGRPGDVRGRPGIFLTRRQGTATIAGSAGNAVVG